MPKKTWSTLSKADKKHLREMKIFYKWQFEDQIKFLKKQIRLHPQERFFCYECRRIAEKIGLWEKIK
jgi:hypothetical protein